MSKSVIPDREHICTVYPRDMERLRKWLDRPNGSLTIGDVTFEAVVHGGVWVRTKPYNSRREANG